MLFSPLVAQTFGRLAGISALLELLDGSMPESEWAENEELKQRAEEEDWEFWEFDVERQVLEERFQFWLPRFTAYSVVTLLYTVVEVQLATCAKVAYLDRKTRFAPTDMRGRGIEAAVLYLEKVGAFEVKRDTAWQTICDLRDVRHLVVHRAGTKGESEEHRKTAHRLAEAYQGRIVFPDSDWSWYGEVWISIPLCREFITTIEGFFDRVFASLDLPPRFKARAAEDAG